MLSLVDMAPEPSVPGLAIPFWTPYAVLAAAVVILPVALVGRLPIILRLGVLRWLSLIPIAGLALASWAYMDVYVMQLGWEQGCVDPMRFPPCFQADAALLGWALTWAVLAAALAIALVVAVRRDTPARENNAIAKGILVLVAGSSVIGAVALSLAGPGGLPYSVAGEVGTAVVTVGFPALAIACLAAPLLSGSWGKASRIAAAAHGIISMAFAIFVAAVALGPPPVFA